MVLALDSLELVAPQLLQGPLSLGSAYHPGLGTWPTWSLLATPAVQRSKPGGVTNAKAKIQIRLLLTLKPEWSLHGSTLDMVAVLSQNGVRLQDRGMSHYQNTNCISEPYQQKPRRHHT